VICVYALVSRAPARINQRGVAGERLRAIRAGGLTAVVGDVKRVPAPTISNLKRYAAVIDALAAAAPAILPARYATTAPGPEELDVMLRARRGPLQQRLRDVRSRVQMTIRIVAPQQAARGRPQSGTEYLRRRMVTAPVLEPIRAAVQTCVTESRAERRGDVVTINHLIPRTAVRRYRAAVEQVAAEQHERVMLTGPHAPYAFAEAW
jgi:hypothetical protein